MANEINAVAGQLWGIPMGQVYTAGPGIKIDNVHKIVSVDETVLFTKTLNDNLWTSESLSESVANFERIRITWARRNSICPIVCTEHYVSDINNVDQIMSIDADVSGSIYRYMTKYKINGATYSESAARYYTYGSTINAWQTTNGWCHPIRIVGINRKSA